MATFRGMMMWTCICLALTTRSFFLLSERRKVVIVFLIHNERRIIFTPSQRLLTQGQNSWKSETEGYDIGVYVDIFPVDYVTDDMAQREQIFKKKKLLYKIRRCKLSHSNYLSSSLAYHCYRWLPLPVALINRWINRLVVNTTPTSTVANMTEAGPSIKGCFAAADIATAVDIEFEGKMYKTMVGYKDYLTHTYGDYMTLPPVEQRVTHSFEAWWL
jgi:lipopolysaccharide cholinephosphotransferase